MSTLGAAAPPAPARLARARSATRLLFAVLGFFAGAWGAHIPSLKARHAIDEATLAWVLLSAAFGAVSALLFAGRVVERWGVRRATVGAGLALAVALAGVLPAPGLAIVVPLAFVLGAGSSLFDVAINSAGTELEHLGGTPVMSNLHAMFSVGGMLAAALVAALLRAGVDPVEQLLLIALALALCTAAGVRGLLDAAPVARTARRARFVRPHRTLLLIGLLILAGMIAEGVMYDWCVLYLKQELGMAPEQAVLGYAAFAGAMAASRFAGDALRRRYPERTLLVAGGSLAAVAMAAVLLLRIPAVAVIGFALVGAGLAPVAPILYNAATRVPGVGRASAIATVTAIGYSGFLVGPPLIGGIAHATSLGVALGVVVAGAALLALGSRRVPEAPSAVPA